MPKQAAAPVAVEHAADDKPQEEKFYTLQEVEKHDHPTDCWVIVRGSVYDVTDWVPKHPGGNLIFVKAGKDCTQLFDSYHPLSARHVLAKFYIGRVKLQAGETLTNYDKDTDFYTVTRSRVEKYFREHKLNPRVAAGMYIKSACILGGLVLFAWGAFFAACSFQLALLSAVMLGACMAEVGVSVMHDANHGAYSNRPWICHIMGATLDLVGASSFMWKQQHVVGHHSYTNVEDLDPDIRVNDPDVRRVTHAQPWQPYQENQHLYLGLLYGLLALKSVVLDDFTALSKGHIGAVKLTPLTLAEQAVFWGGKVLFALWFVVLPLVKSHRSFVELLGLWLVAELVTGWLLAFMFQVAHVTDDVAFLPRDPKTGVVHSDWASAQVATTADFSHSSFFWTHFSGGLNYQVVHHLFPGINHCHYPSIAPIVLDTCKEFGIQYTVYPSFWSALAAHFKHLKAVGSSGRTQSVPSLATVG